MPNMERRATSLAIALTAAAAGRWRDGGAEPAVDAPEHPPAAPARAMLRLDVLVASDRDGRYAPVPRLQRGDLIALAREALHLADRYDGYRPAVHVRAASALTALWYVWPEPPHPADGVAEQIGDAAYEVFRAVVSALRQLTPAAAAAPLEVAEAWVEHIRLLVASQSPPAPPSTPGSPQRRAQPRRRWWHGRARRGGHQ